MNLQFVEATDGIAYGKFVVGRLDAAELATKSAMPEAGGAQLLSYAGRRRFASHTTLVMDLQRGTGFVWPLSGGRTAMRQYLVEHYPNIENLVCWLYLPFVMWLYDDGRWGMGKGDVAQIPRYLELSESWR